VITKSGSCPATTTRISRPSIFRPVRRALPRSSTSRATVIAGRGRHVVQGDAVQPHLVSGLAAQPHTACILTTMTAATPRGRLTPGSSTGERSRTTKTTHGVRGPPLRCVARRSVLARGPQSGTARRSQVVPNCRSFDGHGWFRTSDLSRVKRYLTPRENARSACK
jgi:hypothetical protein